MSDRQKDKVYAWEDQWLHWQGANAPTKMMRAWVRWACKLYDVPPPVVRKVPAKLGYSYYEDRDHSIGLAPKHHAIAVALHETAHAIAVHYRGVNGHGHGPDFMGIFLYLLETAGIAPRSALRASVEAKGIKYTRLRDIHPKYIRKR